MVTASCNVQAPTPLHRELRSGVGYRISPEPGGVTELAVHDQGGNTAVIVMDRSDARQVIDDIETTAGLKPTPAICGIGGAIANSIRMVFKRIEDLDKTDPTTATQLRRAMVGHLRSSCPSLLEQP